MPRRPYPTRHRLLSALLALLVRATSVGLTAARHRCRLSGRSTVALRLPGRVLPAADGCGRPAARAKRRPRGCCDISHVLHKLDAKASAGNAAHWLPTPPATLPPALLPASAWAGLAAGAPLAAGVAVGTAANSSPPGAPRAGRVLLTRYCTLIV